ncbi:Putative sodium-dependent transporter [Candidatus Syntrophocurvum alkaliphilum]|uniref:Sodium-dependent transporter n=1 Tax=Candidatus Syntrophocurvum alkaliphilum TaxID=2293317 RepID=A0A6I6DJ52_9FIRM|nr:bile acid:sodium symporter [Candidatus Syntrophocurvum alkaliphilum]QGU00154.1 Putative sodium-dependent transporter [Candidatus Syntrophocurvum alkaliphilum]
MKIIMAPKNNIALSVVITLVLGFNVGLFIDTTSLTQFIIPITMLMVFPSMIGFRLNEVLNLNNKLLLVASLVMNFVIIPISAFFIGSIFLFNHPELFAGLAVLAILPTSNMAIVYTLIAGGDVTTTIKIMVFSIILGAILAPWYLLVMVGNHVLIDTFAILKTIGLVILIPLILGLITYHILLKKFTEQYFEERIKPIFPAISAWGMVYIIFSSISLNSHTLINQPSILILAFFVQVFFYTMNYLISMIIGKLYFKRKEAIAFVFSTAHRNLAIAIGLATTIFGTNAAIMVAVAILVQSQFGAGFIKFLDIKEKPQFLFKPWSK